MADMQSDLVSIIVTTYKRPEYLGKTLLSILNQTYRNIEVVVVSDGYSEEDSAVCRSLNDPRVKHLYIEHAGRPAVPRNFGISQVRGEFVAFCDDDDLWSADKLARQVDSLVKEPSAMLSYTNVSYIDEYDQPIESVSDRPTDFKAHLYKNNITFSSVLVRRSVLDQVPRFDERMVIRASEDFLFLARILSKFKFSYINAPLLQYRIHQQGISYARNSPSRMMKYYKRISLCLWALYKEGRIGIGDFLRLLAYHGKSISKIILFPYVKGIRDSLSGR